MSAVWHDASEPPARGVVWIYSEGLASNSGHVEMATYNQITSEWRSAFNPDVILREPLAWAVVEYPAYPVRCWLAVTEAGEG